MIIIDGSEGGGQILRTAIGLAAIVRKPIKVINIRKARSNPGLRAQHLEGIMTLAKICNAKVKGARIGSMEIEFIPGEIEAREVEARISTAGSIALLFQSIQLAACFANDIVTVKVKGGATAGKWAPTIDYVKNVFLPIVKKMGYRADVEVIREGFYPKGGAEVIFKIYPVKKLKPIELLNRGKVLEIRGRSVAANLPSHIPERQARSAEEFLKSKGFERIEISRENVKALCPGTCITLYAICENTILGSDNIGEKGVPAEEVGKKAAEDLYKSISSNAALDKHMSDQILTFMAVADGISRISIEEFTKHCETNIKTIEKILGVKFKRYDNVIEVEGIGVER